MLDKTFNTWYNVRVMTNNDNEEIMRLWMKMHGADLMTLQRPTR